MGWGTLIGGVAALITVLFSMALMLRKHQETNRAIAQKLAEDTVLSREELKRALADHAVSIENHVTANRVQTMRYVDRKIQPLADGQDILLGMLADVDEKVTKKANNVRHKELVSVETKG